MYTGVLNQNWIRSFNRSINYPIVHPSRLYEDNQAKIKIVLEDRINAQSSPLGVLITAPHELHLRKKIDMVDTRSNMQLYYLNFKPHGGKSLRCIIYRVIGVFLYPPPGYEHHKKIFLAWSMDPLTAKCICMIIQKKNDEVYTLLNFRSI